MRAFVNRAQVTKPKTTKVKQPKQPVAVKTVKTAKALKPKAKRAALTKAQILKRKTGVGKRVNAKAKRAALTKAQIRKRTLNGRLVKRKPTTVRKSRDWVSMAATTGGKGVATAR